MTSDVTHVDDGGGEHARQVDLGLERGARGGAVDAADRQAWKYNKGMDEWVMSVMVRRIRRGGSRRSGITHYTTRRHAP